MKRCLFLAFACLTVCSCSLLKFTMDTGDQPLSRAQVNTRTMVRAFYKDFSGAVTAAADSIYRATDSLELKLRAIEWKIRSTSMCANAAYGTIPEISLLNTWALCYSMERRLSDLPDSLLFGELSSLARDCAHEMHGNIVTVARQTLEHSRFEKMEEFVGKNATIQQEDLMLRWIKFLGVADSTYIATTGSIAQAIADVSEKASGYSSQWGDVLSWNKDLLTTQLSTKEVRTEIHARMDSLQRQFDRVIGVAENAPQTAAELLDELNDQFNELMSTANASLYRVFDELEHQRQDIQSFIDSQRTRLIAQADTLAAHTVRTAMDMLPSVVGRLALYIVLAIVVLFSIPFALGYLAGRARSRRKAQNDDRENTPDPNNR